MKIFNILLTIVFSLFAIVQINDPDSLPWILMYAFVALVSGLAIFGRYVLWLIVGGMIVTLVWAIILAPDVFSWLFRTPDVDLTQDMSDDMPFIEIAREFFGLVIAFFGLSFHLIAARVADKKSE